MWRTRRWECRVRMQGHQPGPVGCLAAARCAPRTRSPRPCPQHPPPRSSCPLAGVIAIVVYGLYGNSTAHFELESSRHMRDSGANRPARGARPRRSACALAGRRCCAPDAVHLQTPPVARPPLPAAAAVRGCLSFALNGLVFFFAGASAVNFMIRCGNNGVRPMVWGHLPHRMHPPSSHSHEPTLPAPSCRHTPPKHPHPTPPHPHPPTRSAVESLGDYWRAFALFPPLYLALFAIRSAASMASSSAGDVEPLAASGRLGVSGDTACEKPLASHTPAHPPTQGRVHPAV